VFVAIGALGSWLGRRLGNRMPQAMLRRVFGWMLVVVAAFILWRNLVG
jgi:uncharacterized membrane protein YfcA